MARKSDGDWLLEQEAGPEDTGADYQKTQGGSRLGLVLSSVSHGRNDGSRSNHWLM